MQEITTTKQVIDFISTNTKDKVMELTTIKDLKDIYFIISKSATTKKNKEDIYKMIEGMINCMKFSEDFVNFLIKASD